MKMLQNPKKIFLYAIAVIMSIVIIACDKKGDNPLDIGGGGEDSALANYDMDIIMPDNIDYVELGDELGDYVHNDTPRMTDEDGKPVPRKKFSGIFDALELTEQQIASHLELKEQLKNCIEEATAPLREQRQAIINSAKATRSDIIERVRAEAISREDAKVEFTELREIVKSQLEEMKPETNPREECLEAYNTAFGELLNAEQLEKWTAFLSNQKENFESDKRDRKMRKRKK
jgi:hypothetical protein